MEYDPNLTPAYLAGKVDEYVKYAARDTINRNAKRDRNARYARIPDAKACPFCRMLGSRGFVYHSESKAGGAGGKYHPYCNCQIAVSFDPFIEEYKIVSGSDTIVTVTRGYGMEDAQLVRPGRDRSFEMREFDIDQLFDEYKTAGRKFNPKRKYRDYSHGALLTDGQFAEAMERLSNAKTRDELHEVAQKIVDEWTPNAVGRNQSQWDAMSRLAKELDKQFENDAQRGALSGAIRGDREKEREHAESYYAQVLNRKRDQVLKTFGEESSLTSDEIERAFNHLLIDEHDLDDGTHRFYPDYEIAQSMQRLLSGDDVKEHDRLLFAHEYLESVYMEQGYDQRAAHEMANMKYNYEKALNEWLEAGADV